MPFVVGANCSGITNYGKNDITPFASAAQIEDDLAAIKAWGGTIVRVFVANNEVSDQESANRLNAFLVTANSYGIKVLASLIDFYGDNGWHPSSCNGEYTDNGNLGDAFFASHYTNGYLSFVRTVVSTNAGHPGLYAWEPGNELKDVPNPSNFIAFMQAVTQTIRSLDSSTAIASGIINAANLAVGTSTPASFYNAVPLISIVTVHAYNGDRGGVADIQYAKANGKIAMLEEGLFGAPCHSSDRSGAYTSELNFWQSQNLDVFLQWGFVANTIISDNGNGDGTYGMDVWCHSDYAGLATVLAGYTGFGVPCGGQSQICCTSGAPCNAGFSCQNNICQPITPPPCGTEGQTCCAGSVCTDGSSCINNTCVQPEIGCTGPQDCQYPYTTCDTASGLCLCVSSTDCANAYGTLYMCDDTGTCVQGVNTPPADMTALLVGGAIAAVIVLAVVAHGHHQRHSHAREVQAS